MFCDALKVPETKCFIRAVTDKLLSIADVIDRLPGVSERRLRERIREIGCYHQIGKQMFLMEADFQELLEHSRAKPKNASRAHVSLSKREINERMAALRAELEPMPSEAPRKRKLTPESPVESKAGPGKVAAKRLVRDKEPHD